MGNGTTWYEIATYVRVREDEATILKSLRVRVEPLGHIATEADIRHDERR